MLSHNERETINKTVMQNRMTETQKEISNHNRQMDRLMICQHAGRPTGRYIYQDKEKHSPDAHMNTLG